VRTHILCLKTVPTLELDFTEADDVVREAAQKRGGGAQEADWLDAFYRNAESRILDIYDRSRIIAWRIYDREEAAAYWREQTEAAEKILENLERARGRVAQALLPEIPAMLAAIKTASEIVEACRGSYELFA